MLSRSLKRFINSKYSNILAFAYDYFGTHSQFKLESRPSAVFDVSLYNILSCLAQMKGELIYVCA